MNSSLQRLAACAAMLCVYGVTPAQQGEMGPSQSTRLKVLKPAELPNSVDKTGANKKHVLVVPEADVFKGVELSEAQKQAISANLRSAKFSAVNASAGPLPTNASGQPMMVMQQFEPPPSGGLFGDSCAMADFSSEQVAALRKLLLKQLEANKGDVVAFTTHTPKDCRRKEMIYYMKLAVALTP